MKKHTDDYALTVYDKNSVLYKSFSRLAGKGG